MKKYSVLLFTLFFIAKSAFSQDSLNMSKLGHLPYPVLLSNIWGYETEGHEYALVGTFDGMSLVDVTDPANPDEVYFKSGPHSSWREMKVFDDHAYISTENGGGIQIIDLSPLPQNTNLSSVNYTGNQYPFTSAHTLFIDENGILYLFGSDYSEGGAIMYDLNTDPSSPVELGVFDDYYIHDGFVRGDTLWASCINDGFLSIVDVSDKANAAEVTTFNTPNNFTHNSWPNEDNHYLFTTDERSNAYVASYDVSDFDNITELDLFQHHPGSNSIPHNTHFLNDYLFTSWYTDGVVIIDASDPNSLVEAGFYDTSPNFTGNGFNGCWGVYPYLPSGNIIASDMNSGLWILGFNNARACYLEGTVTDITNSSPLSGVSVEILSTSGVTLTDITGDYETGFPVANTYQVQFSKLGYVTQVINNVVLTAGNTTVVDVQMVPDTPFTFTGQVIEEGTGDPVPGALVKIIHPSSLTSFTATADGSGNYSIPQFYAGNYEVTAGKWSYITQCDIPALITSATIPLITELEKGYYDDFTLHFGWTGTGSSQTGRWERVAPQLTSFDGQVSNPGTDVVNDCFDLAFVTGNGGGSAGDDDVDDGNVILTSPVFDVTGYTNPYLYYTRWYFNGGGNGSDANDTMKIELSDGSQTVLVERIVRTDTLSKWIDRSFRIADYITPSANLRLKVTVTDSDPGHLVEGGLDKFYIEEFSGIGLDEKEAAHLNIYPNPSSGIFTIEYELPSNSTALMTLYDITGRAVIQTQVTGKGSVINSQELSPGIYILKLQDAPGKTFFLTKKMIISGK